MAGKMGQQVKVLATKPDNESLIPEHTWWKETTNPLGQWFSAFQVLWPVSAVRHAMVTPPP